MAALQVQRLSTTVYNQSTTSVKRLQEHAYLLLGYDLDPGLYCTLAAILYLQDAGLTREEDSKSKQPYW